MHNLKFLLFSLALTNHTFAAFEEVTVDAGVDRLGQSFGSSWGDFNGDGFPDLWVSNHADAPSLYLNNGDGTFTDIAMQVWPGRLLPADTVCETLTEGVCLSDTHAAAWADFDNDGDQDLLEVVGGERGNHLFINDGNEFIEESQDYGLRAMGTRSRTPGWLDWNNDGRLDAILTHDLNAQVHPLLLTNQGDLFTDAQPVTGIGQHASTSLHLVDLDEDLRPEIFLSRGNSNSGKAFSSASLPFVNVLPGLPVTQGFLACTDAVFEDFDGDQRVDVFSTCGGSGQEVLQRNERQIDAKMLAFQREDAIEFDGMEAVTISVYPSFSFVPEDHLRVGASAFVPAVIEHPELGWRSFSFTLNPLDPAIAGVPPHVAGGDLGLYVSFDDQKNRWRIALSTPAGAGLNVVAKSNGVLSNLAVLGFNGTPLTSFPKYARRVDGGFEDRRSASGFTDRLACGSAAGGDFDNDGDVDLYLVCSNPISNLPNRLYLNDGNGNFALAADNDLVAGSDIGGGDTVTVVDYDEDGFLDLFVNNGTGGAPFHFGPNQLFRNLGNDNHWLEIDLIGLLSNRDGIGATVTAQTANGTQYRLQDGGLHAKAQDHQRLHFGLANQSTVQVLTVNWPSGSQSTLTNVAADQILTITEPSDADGDALPDTIDNCTWVVNGDQTDTDMDGHGDACDADFNNDCAVNVQDLGLFRTNFLLQTPLYDLSGDGQVNFVDLGLLRLLFFQPVGPSASGALCSS